MARKPAENLTDGELRLMDVLWDHGPSTVLEIQAGLDDDLADSTIRTLLGVLETKGWVKRKRSGRAHLYVAAADREAAREKALHHMVKRFFQSQSDLVLTLLDSEELDARELEEIRASLDKRRRRGK